MNNKTQQIIDFIQGGKTYKQIKDEIRVSPSRIAAVKEVIKRREIIKKSLIASNDDENGSDSSGFGSVSSDFGSKSSKNRPITAEQCRFAELNGSEIAEIVACQREILQFRKEKWQAEHEFDKEILQNKVKEAINRENEQKLKEKELKLKEDELKFKIQQAEGPLKLLFFRLRHYTEAKNLDNLNYNGAVRNLESIKQLKLDYQAQAYADNFTFENKPHAKAIEDLIKVYEKYIPEMKEDPQRSPDMLFKMDIKIIKIALYTVIIMLVDLYHRILGSIHKSVSGNFFTGLWPEARGERV